MSLDNTPDNAAGSDSGDNYTTAEHWEPDGLRARIYNNEDLFKALLNSFLGDSPKNAKNLLEAAQNQNLKALKEVSHLLKGVCGQLCANRLHKICVRIEQIAVTAPDQINEQELQALCSDFSQELNTLEQLFQEALAQDKPDIDETDTEQLDNDEFLNQITQLQVKLGQSEYIDPDSLSPLKSAYRDNQAIQNLVKRLIEEINLFDNTAASATLNEITRLIRND